MCARWPVGPGDCGAHRPFNTYIPHKCRARYISNTLLAGDKDDDDDDDEATTAGAHTGGNGCGGQHDLVRHKMESVMDDPWIEDIRAQDFLVRNVSGRTAQRGAEAS